LQAKNVNCIDQLVCRKHGQVFPQKLAKKREEKDDWLSFTVLVLVSPAKNKQM
jgi:hypothetical protein